MAGIMDVYLLNLKFFQLLSPKIFSDHCFKTIHYIIYTNKSEKQKSELCNEH